MNNEIKLLDTSLLKDKKKLKQITYWLNVMNRPNGWHYDLDQVWILEELEKAGVLPGSTIIDAGAGQGVTQYLLAAKGYNVISLDFSPREKPRRSKGIFTINGEGGKNIEYQHPYMSFIKYNRNSSKANTKILTISNLKKIMRLPLRIGRQIKSFMYYVYERFMKSHDSFGTITYLRAAFHDVPLPKESADAVISVSAIEHADIDLFSNNIQELTRLIKPGGVLLVTTSATSGGENTYHEKSSGWCFSFDSLKTYFPNYKISFDTDMCARSMKESKIFLDRLDPYYYKDANSFCYKKNITEFPYLPVAIKMNK